MSHQLRFSIERYSYATNASASTSSGLRWNHLAEDGMLLTVERSMSGSFGDEVYLKILLTNSVPEELPLRKLSQQAETSLAKGLIQNVADLPLSVVVGRPRLAISYIAFNGQLRRFQIRFKHEDDFDNVLNTLHELRCNIRESQIRPSTAEQPRPTTTGALQNTFAIPPAPVETARPTSAAATFYRPTASASDIAAYRADPWSQSNHDRSISRGPSFPPPSSQSQQQGLTSFIPPSSQAHTGDFRGANELNHSHYSSNRDSTVPEHPAQHMGLGMSAQRPTSTTFAVNAESASQILPPRRILPFSPSPTKPPPSAAPIPSASSNERPASRKRPASSASTSAPKKPAKARNSRGPMSTVAELEDKLGSKAALAPMDVNKPTPSFRPANAKPSLAEPVTIEVPSSQQAQAGISEHGQASVLHEYATTPTGERQAVIDTMFCQLIADDDFKILCGDVESAWRRIGLGY